MASFSRACSNLTMSTYLIFPPKMKHGLRANRTAGGRWGRSTGTIRIYLYSSWLKYCNDESVAQLIITIGSMMGVRSPVGYGGPALYVYRLLHFTRTPATDSHIFHCRILYIFSPALPHFTNTPLKPLKQE